MALAPRRVVSLLAAATELVCELGAGSRLVGRSHECDRPTWVKSLPVVSRPSFDVTGTSAQIDARVREKLSAGQPLYAIDLKLLSALDPDLILSQTHCDVCAVTPAQLGHDAAAPCAHPLLALGASSVEGILKDFLQAAQALGLFAQGQKLVQDIRARLDALGSRTYAHRRPSVVCLEWIEPVFPMSNWVPEIVGYAGGISLMGQPGHHSTSTPWEALRAADPDVLVVAPCGFDLPRTLAEISRLRVRAGFEELRAVRSGRVYAADGNLYFNRSGPSLFETPDLLAEMLHPGVFPPTREGSAWARCRLT